MCFLHIKKKKCFNTSDIPKIETRPFGIHTCVTCVEMNFSVLTANTEICCKPVNYGTFLEVCLFAHNDKIAMNCKVNVLRLSKWLH